MTGVPSSPLPRVMIEACHSIAHDLFGRYRPEMHYMRGPGPKCREKRRAAEAAERMVPHADIAHVRA
jgi:hypothetical protein